MSEEGVPRCRVNELDACMAVPRETSLFRPIDLLVHLLAHRRIRLHELEHAQVDTLRLKLVKIGARVRETSRRIWLHLASGYPYQRLFLTVLRQLQAHSP